MPEPVAALDAARLPEALRRIHAALAARRVEIDALNVFPVPDGDTGTNMLMTVRAALDALDADGSSGAEAAEAWCDAVIRAAMRGARGNSGVILSQILRALAETMATRGPLDARGVAGFLRRARELAYDAVAQPVEGTILTAVTVAADTADDVAGHGGSVRDVLSAARAAVHDAVVRTQEQLEELRTAGVVDAGARGFEVVAEALDEHVRGVPFAPVDAAVAPVCRAHGEIPLASTGGLTHRFEVQYLLDAPEPVAPLLRRALEQLGDSVVVVAAGGLVTVHVHTDDVGAAIEAGLEHGRPSRIEVTYFADQVAAGGVEPAAGLADSRDAPGGGGQGVAAAEPRRLGCVVVLPGPGLRELAEALGATVVEGAAGALPSVADLLNAIGAVQAERIAILPGHRNAVPTAYQASEVSVAEGGRTLDVVASADTTPAALAALAVSDLAAEPAGVLADMEDAAAAVRAGEVVAAVRDATTPIGEVTAGQFLAVADGTVVAVTDDPVAAVRSVVEACRRDGCDLVTLVVGADVAADEAAAAESAVRAVVPDAEVERVQGGQRPARYLVGVE